MRFLSAFFVSYLLIAPLLAQNAAESASGPNFTDVTSARGVRFQYVPSHTSKKYLLETMGPGVALFDYDSDGRLDLFLVNGAY